MVGISSSAEEESQERSERSGDLDAGKAFCLLPFSFNEKPFPPSLQAHLALEKSVPCMSGKPSLLSGDATCLLGACRCPIVGMANLYGQQNATLKEANAWIMAMILQGLNTLN